MLRHGIEKIKPLGEVGIAKIAAALEISEFVLDWCARKKAAGRTSGQPIGAVNWF